MTIHDSHIQFSEYVSFMTQVSLHLTKRFTILQGLKTGDQIVRFGSINGENSQGLHDIASVVQHSKGVKIQNIQVKNLFSFIILRYKLIFNPIILHIYIFALYQSPLSIIVEREGKRHTLSLTPNTWSGRGLLGYACLVILFIYLFLLLLPESVMVFTVNAHSLP